MPDPVPAMWLLCLDGLCYLELNGKLSLLRNTHVEQSWPSQACNASLSSYRNESLSMRSWQPPPDSQQNSCSRALLDLMLDLSTFERSMISRGPTKRLDVLQGRECNPVLSMMMTHLAVKTSQHGEAYRCPKRVLFLGTRPRLDFDRCALLTIRRCAPVLA